MWLLSVDGEQGYISWVVLNATRQEFSRNRELIVSFVALDCGCKLLLLSVLLIMCQVISQVHEFSKLKKS